MMTLFGLAIYVLIGILGGKIFGYRGLIDTILWPITFLCAWLFRRGEEDDETD